MINYNNKLLIFLLIFAILIVYFSYNKLQSNEGMINLFSQAEDMERGFVQNIENPGKWIGEQIGGIWNSLEPPLAFMRNTTFNVVPNFTWVTRYYEKKNDWIRANKGMPPLSPSPTASVAKMNLDYKNDNYNVALGKYNQSLVDIIA